jgi:two-component system, NtrC family, sensor histidine kinase HydH
MNELHRDKRLWLIVLMVVIISVLHYSTAVTMGYLHEFYKLLYYLPIILAAFYFGQHGGLITSLSISLIYLPHLMFQWTGQFPHNLDRFLEIILYNVVAVITGRLAENERRERTRYQQAAGELEKSYQNLQQQAEQLQEIEGQLRHSERLAIMGELAASFAHEVRNPLGAIHGAVEIIEDEISPESPNREFVEVLKKEVSRLNQVIDNYLSLARRAPETASSFEFAGAVQAVVSILAATARKNKNHFRLEFPTKPIRLMAEEAKFRQVVLNLLLNALAASPAGSEIILSANLQNDGGLLIFSIEDHGAGMTPEVLQQAMQPFFTTKEHGTGLGLPISKRIVEQFGWTMDLESAPDRGTRVTIRIPLPDTEESNPKRFFSNG